MKRILILLTAFALCVSFACAETVATIDELRAMMEQAGETWLFCNTGSTGAPEYRKLAVVGEIEGYRFAAVEPGIMDENLHYCVYLPVTENVPAQNVSIQMGLGAADVLAKNFELQVANYAEVLYVGEMDVREVNGFELYTIVLEYRLMSYEEADAYDYIQSAVSYMESSIDNRCVALNAVNLTHEECAEQNRAAMCELLYRAAQNIEMN